MKKLFPLLVAFLLLGAPSGALGEDVYDSFKKIGSLSITCATPNTQTISARAVCVEAKSTNTGILYFRCDATPVIGSGATLRAGLAAGEKTCFDVTLRHTMCEQVRYCGTVAGDTIIIRWVK